MNANEMFMGFGIAGAVVNALHGSFIFVFGCIIVFLFNYMKAQQQKAESLAALPD